MRLITLLCCVVSIGAASSAPVVSEVLATQVALDRAGFSPGEIDGHPGENLQRALSAFQQSHQLPATGHTDNATWKQLMSAGGDVRPLIDYTLTDADIAGPFTPDIPPNLPDQAS